MAACAPKSVVTQYNTTNSAPPPFTATDQLGHTRALLSEGAAGSGYKLLRKSPRAQEHRFACVQVPTKGVTIHLRVASRLRFSALCEAEPRLADHLVELVLKNSSEE